MIVICPRSTPMIVGVQVPELDAENGGLQFIEPRIEARELADVTLGPSVFAQVSYSLREHEIVCHDRSAITEAP